MRSVHALAYLQQRQGYQNLLSLRGGVAAWADAWTRIFRAIN